MSEMSETSPERREAYPSDLTEAEWAILSPLLPMPCQRGRPQGGRPAEVDLREVVNGLLYHLYPGLWLAEFAARSAGVVGGALLVRQVGLGRHVITNRGGA